MKTSPSRVLLATLVDAGILKEQCACGCEHQFHRLIGTGGNAGFCTVCWDDRCNYYRGVYVLDERAADEYDADAVVREQEARA